MIVRMRIEDQAKAWRLIAAFSDDDDHLRRSITAEAVDGGLVAVEGLITALAANCALYLKGQLGRDGLDELIATQLAFCDTHAAGDG